MTRRLPRKSSLFCALLAALALLLPTIRAEAQAPAPAPAPAPAAPSASPSPSPPAAPSAMVPGATPVDIASLAVLGWLEGCWRGTVNQREFREHWLPLRGGMMLGASQNVLQDKTLDFEYLRLEARPDGIHYVAVPSDSPPTDFRLVRGATDERGTQFVFNNVSAGYPERLVYHRGAEGWLYASIEGTRNGESRTVTYPMRRISCDTGEPIRK